MSCHGRRPSSSLQLCLRLWNSWVTFRYLRIPLRAFRHDKVVGPLGAPSFIPISTTTLSHRMKLNLLQIPNVERSIYTETLKRPALTTDHIRPSGRRTHATCSNRITCDGARQRTRSSATSVLLLRHQVTRPPSSCQDPSSTNASRRYVRRISKSLNLPPPRSLARCAPLRPLNRRVRRLVQ